MQVDSDAIVHVLSVLGISVAAAGAALKLFLDKVIEHSVKSKFDKITEAHRVELNRALEEHKLGLSRQLETAKLQNILIADRSKSANKACADLASLRDQVRRDLEEFLKNKTENYLDAIIYDFHRERRERFDVIRSQFEVANDLFSSYSLAFSAVLSPNVLKEVVGALPRQGRRDVRVAYLKVWELLVHQLTCLVRVSSDYRFWDPADNYGERADAWAQYDFKALVEFLKRSAREQGGGGPETYYLSIERSGGIKKFWEERPPEAPKNAAVEAAGPLPD